MTTRRPGRILVPLASCAAVVGIALTSCTGPTEQQTPPPQAPKTPAVEVTEQTLGEAVGDMMGVDTSSDDVDASCFASATTDAGLSDKAQSQLVEKGYGDLVAASQGLQQEYPDDAVLLISDDLRTTLDRCTDATVDLKQTSHTSYDEPAPAPGPKEGKPDTKAKYHFDGTIETAAQVEPGVVRMMSSFTDDEKTQKIYKKAGACMAESIVDSGMSQKGLKFIGGGAALGSGSIAQHLSKDDRKVWESDSLVGQLTTCTDIAREGGDPNEDLDDPTVGD